MKIFLLPKLLTLLFIVIGFTIETNLTGKWVNTDYNMSYTFKQQDSVLTGELTSPYGTQDIINGKIFGNNFSFNLKKATSDNIHLTGKYYRDSITTDFTTINGAFHLKFNRTE